MFLYRKNIGQSVLEYAILLSIVSAACVVMVLYVRRAVQGRLYAIEDRVTSRVAPGTIRPI